MKQKQKQKIIEINKLFYFFKLYKSSQTCCSVTFIFRIRDFLSSFLAEFENNWTN